MKGEDDVQEGQLGWLSTAEGWMKNLLNPQGGAHMGGVVSYGCVRTLIERGPDRARGRGSPTVPKQERLSVTRVAPKAARNRGPSRLAISRAGEYAYQQRARHPPHGGA